MAPLPSEPEITICSVSFESAAYLALNYELTQQLNQGQVIRWVIVENTPADQPGRLTEGDPRFSVIPGVNSVLPTIKEKHRASYQHGAALNKALAVVETRFVLIVDPDFFIVKPQWVAEVLGYMQKNGLSFFGAPWHVRWHRKYRYFPCVHAMIIDLERVGRSELDFQPSLDKNPVPPSTMVWTRYEQLRGAGRPLRALGSLLRHLPTAIHEDRQQRLLIGSSHDTGYSVFERFAKDARHSAALVQPVFRPRVDTMMPPSVSPLQTLPIVEKFWSESQRYLPDRTNYFSVNGFRELGLIDLTEFDWEEFLWQGQPFGFHVRGYLQRHGRFETTPDQVRQMIERLTGLTLNVPVPV